MFWSLLKKNNVCLHTQVKPDADYIYCPDCGELIENQWYLVRCSCCGIKLKAYVKNGQIIPENKFCHNCGNKGYVVERIDKINFIDISYAVLIKAIVENKDFNYTQSWVDSTKKYRTKLIGYNY